MDQSKAKRSFHALENLQTAYNTYRERNRDYGDNYKQFGKMMLPFFPNGLTLKTEDDWNRFGVLMMIFVKLSRYVQQPNKGHHDSIHDMGVYAFMLEELDAAIAGLDTTHPDKKKKGKRR